MLEIARLSGYRDWIELDVVEREWVPEPAIAFDGQTHLAGLSLENRLAPQRSGYPTQQDSYPRLGPESLPTARSRTESESHGARQDRDSDQQPAVLAVRRHQKPSASGWPTVPNMSYQALTE